MATSVRKAVLPVAGMATRFLPASKAVPKVMLPVVDKPLIQYAVEEARAAGIEEIIFVTGRGEAAIRHHFDRDEDLNAYLAARRDDKALALAASAVLAPGTAALRGKRSRWAWAMPSFVRRNLVGDEPFAVLLPDELLLGDPPCLAELVEVHRRTGGSVVALAEVPQAETCRYGIVEVAAEEGRTVTLSGMVEKPDPDRAPSRLALIGRYVLQPGVFTRLAAQAPGAGGEIQLTDAMASMVREEQFHGVRFTGRRFDCGSPGWISAGDGRVRPGEAGAEAGSSAFSA